MRGITRHPPPATRHPRGSGPRIGAALLSTAIVFGAGFAWEPSRAEPGQPGPAPARPAQPTTQADAQDQTAVPKGEPAKSVPAAAPVAVPPRPGEAGGPAPRIPPAYQRKRLHLAGTTPPKPAVLRQLMVQQRRVSSQQLLAHPRVDAARHRLQAAPDAPTPALETFDWSQRGVVGSVKDQQLCGDCWNFAAVGVFESMYAIRNGGQANLLDLSEEELLRCNTQSPQGTCCGGWWPFDYIRDKGLVGASKFPYSSGTIECPGTPPGCGDVSGRRYQAVTWDYVDGADGVPAPDVIKKALCDHGPLIAAVAVTDNFQNYRPENYPGGVFQEAGVSIDSINHAVMIVGWTPRGWIVCNSWGADWGANGYILIAYGSNFIGYGAAWVEVDPYSP